MLWMLALAVLNQCGGQLIHVHKQHRQKDWH
jgi:hypothetical protein